MGSQGCRVLRAPERQIPRKVSSLRSALSGVTVDELAAEAGSFPKLKRLVLGCGNISSSSCIDDLCKTMASCLEWLELRDDDMKVLSSELVTAIGASCAQLRSIRVFSRCLIMADIKAMLDALLSSCAHIMCISLHSSYDAFNHDDDGDYADEDNPNCCELQLCKHADGRRTCALKVVHCLGNHKEEMFSSICCALLQQGIAIRSVDWADCESDSQLRVLADNFGNTVEEIVCRPNNETNETDFEYAFTRFPNLTSLDIGQWVSPESMNLRPPINDRCIAALSRCCPLITSLKLFFGTITDAGVAAMLEAHNSRTMKVLDFSECSLLSDATLLKIAELFPSSLDYLSLEGTQVKKETMLMLVDSGKLKVRTIDFGHDDEEN